MALRKEIETKYGFTANYWRVNSVIIDKQAKEGSCIISVYKDEETAMVATESIQSRYVNLFLNIPSSTTEEERKEIASERYDNYFGTNSEYTDIYQACYNMIKELDNYFIDTVDC